jgi:hypothetical protein
VTRSLWWAVCCGAAALLLSVPALYDRYRVEQGNRAVELVVEYPELLALAGAADRDLNSVLKAFKEAGVSGIVMYEDTIPDLMAAGRISAFYPDYGYVMWDTDPDRAAQIWGALEGKFGWKPVEHRNAQCNVSDSGYPQAGVDYGQPLSSVGSAGLGIDHRVVRRLKRLDFDVVGRVGNYLGADKRGIRWTLRDLKEAGCSTALFVGTQVLGAPDLIPFTAEGIRETGLRYAYVEFGKQVGDARLLKETADTAIRLHSILPAELATTTREAAAERLVRAARERNCRMLYIRLFATAAEDPVQTNLDYVRRIAAGVERAGMAARAARPIGAPEGGPWTAVAAIGGALLGGIALARALRLPFWLGALCVLPGLLADALGILSPHAVHALVIALCFPTAAVLVASEAAERAGRLAAVGLFVLACAVSLAGALAVAASLSTLPYMLKAQSFVGVKVSLILPVVVVGLVLLARAKGLGSFDAGVRWWHLGLVAVGAAILVVLIVRTGNEAASVSGLEMKLRSLLDRVFSVRPRTKEFLFGHPLLMAGLLAVASRRIRFAPLILAAGAIGQASIVNTFCHIHTPLAVSGLRVLWGVLAGGILGIAVFWLFLWAERWVPRLWRAGSS